MIREDAKGRILLTGLHQVTINSVEDLLNALNFGSSIRQTDTTAINAKSSRSHAVFSLNLIQLKNKAQQMSAQEKRYSMPVEALSASDNWVTIDSKLHFVDLAGSERLKTLKLLANGQKKAFPSMPGLQAWETLSHNCRHAKPDPTCLIETQSSLDCFKTLSAAMPSHT